MTEFVASNGIPVTLIHDGRLVVQNSDHTYPATIASGEHVDALREFFQHERDEDLGRWRWMERPHYVAYARGADRVRIIDERTGRAEDFDRYGEAAWVMEDAAYAYFEAHPERKPWHAAEPGEVWVLTVRGFTLAWVADGDGDFQHLVDPESLHVDDPEIMDGRRIWPEDAS